MDQNRALTIGLAYQMGLIALSDDELEIVRANVAKQALTALVEHARDRLAKVQADFAALPERSGEHEVSAHAKTVLRAAESVHAAIEPPRVAEKYRNGMWLGGRHDKQTLKFASERLEPVEPFGTFGADKGPKAEAGKTSVIDVTQTMQDFARRAQASEGAAS